MFLLAQLAAPPASLSATVETKTATVTSLAVSAAGSPVTSVASGTVVTLTAKVMAGGKAVGPGQVNFCDAKAKYCTDIHLLGVAQLTKAGAAELKFRPGIGSHSYNAVFVETNTYTGSASGATVLQVTGIIPPLPTATTIDQAGIWGAYKLSATVTETGNTAPPSGTVSFLDTNHGNAVLGAGTLGAVTRDVGWTTVNTSAPGVAGVSYAVADLNQDGIPDLFVMDYFGTYDVLLGNGDGTFTVVGSPFGPSSETGSFIVGDFNNDGIPDVAAINAAEYASTGKITIFLGNGDGTFTVAGSSPALGYNPTAIATADMNGDGNSDLIVVQQGSSTASGGEVVIFFGKGDGTFTKASSTTSVPSTVGSILPADLNRDGHVDLVLSGEGGGGITVLLGKGDGTFTILAGPSQSGEANVAVADVNDDGFPDLVFGAAGTSYLTAFLGNGDGTFTEAPSSPNVNIELSGLAIADFNRDGIPDIAYTYGEAGILFGKGDGTFVQSPAIITYPYDFSGTIVVADFNGDGWPDVLTEDGNSRTVIDSLAQPTETATASAALSIAVAGTHLAAASYPGNSNYHSSASGNIALWGAPPVTTTSLEITSQGKTVSSVTPGTVVMLEAKAMAAGRPLTAGQVNFCDATAAFCTGAHLLGTASITSNGTAIFKFAPGPGSHSYAAKFLEDGMGKGSSSNVVSLDVSPAPPPSYFATATLGLNGLPGNYSLTATVEGFGGTAAPMGNVSFVDTSFSNKVLATAPLGTPIAGIGWKIEETPALGGAPFAEVTADFNGDGIPDLALLWTESTYAPTATSVTVLFGKGDGTFTKGPTVQATTGVQELPSMIAGDFNGDGNEDLAILSMSDTDSANYVTVLLGEGNGHFASPVTSVASQLPNEGGDVIPGSLVAADFNGDGKLDVAVVGDSVDDGGVTVLLGKGDGSFTPAGPSIEPTQGFSKVATGDFNGDGTPDLIAIPYFENGGATVFLGKGDGTFTERQELEGINFASSIVVGDFNDDGKLDLAIGYSGGGDGGVTVLLGNGNGTFRPAPGASLQGSGASLVAGDFNGDGKLDLAGVDDNYNRIDLFEGAGDGTFKEIVTTPIVREGVIETFQIVAADFNKNGVPDLAFLSNNQTTAEILLTEPTETETVTVTGIAPIGAGTHNVEASYGGDSHYGKSVSATVQLTAGLELPLISPASGTFTTEQKVTISEAIPGATIYYQASGTVNTNGFVEYTGPFFLPYGGFEEISAYATETGYQQSTNATATYNLNLPAAPAPVFSLVGGSYKETQKVTITDAAPDSMIYYTTNGALPTIDSTAYAGPISVSASELISAVAIAPGYSESNVASAQYLIGSSKSRFVYTVAGTRSGGYSGDGGPATFASLEGPTTVARDSGGDLYIADEYTVRKVAAGTGTITTVAGNGLEGYSGDGGPAAKAKLGYVGGLAVDKTGNLFIADETNCVVRKMAAVTGAITTIVGNGKCGSTGDNGPATKAELNEPAGLAVDKLGNLYIGTASAIRKVAAGTGTITTFAGNGDTGYSGDGGPATKAELDQPAAIVFDASGDLYFADIWDDVVRRIAAGTSIITTVAGKGPQRYGPSGNGDGGPATSATLSNPQGLAIDSAGDLFISDTYDGAVREVTANNKIISTIAGGTGSCNSLGGDGGPALAANLCYPGGLTIDPAGNLFVADQLYQTVREVTAPMAPPTAATDSPVLSLAPGTYATAKTLTITAAAGAEVYLTLNGAVPTTSGEGYYTPIAIAGPVTVNAIALEPDHLPSAVVTATYNVTAPASATINTVAGSGVESFPGSGGPALKAEFGYLYGVAADGTGNLYFADPLNGVVWKLTVSTQTVSVVAGTSGTVGRYSGEGGPATKAILGDPDWVALDHAGNLFISDLENGRILQVSAKTGIISTYAGGGQNGSYPTLGDGGLATEAVLAGPRGIVFDTPGNLYIADSGVNRLRRVDAATGIITSVAGNSSATSLGDGGPATAAMLSLPSNVALDGSGNLYIVDAGNERIRAVAAKTGIITTVAGRGIYGYSGDGGPATDAFISPWGIAVDASGAIYFGNGNNTVRKFLPGGDISTIAGTGYLGFSGDGGPARMADLCGVAGLGFDKAGNLYIVDACNYRVRKVSFPKAASVPTF